MRTPNKTKVICLTALSLLAISCDEDETSQLYTAEAAQPSEEQIEKMAYGCPFSYNDNDEKVETKATDEYLEMLQTRLAEATSFGTNKSAAATQYVGVVKEETCGNYDEIRIFYDCEDHRNRTSSKGYVGGWKITENIAMKFCLVPADLFKNTKDHYGLFNFSTSSHIGNDYEHHDVALIQVHMDAEDKKSETAIFYTKNGEKEIRDSHHLHSNNVMVVGNGNLSFQMFYFKPNNKSTYGYPDLGFNYGVFGVLYSEGDKNRQGNVYSDDEDKNNANNVQVAYDTTDLKDYHKTDFHGLLALGNNTRFYIAKIEAKK